GGGWGMAVGETGVRDPLAHCATAPGVEAFPVYEPHPITRQIALSFFPGIRPISLLTPPSGVTLSPLFRSSTESYTRPVQVVAEREPAGERVAMAAPGPPGRHVLAVAAEGTWPRSTPATVPFRLVGVGGGELAGESVLPYLGHSELGGFVG